MPPALKVAVVGAGYFGRFHAEKLAAMPGVTLVAVADADAERAAAVAKPLGAAPLASHLPLEGKVDAVTIAAATSAHFAIARFFLERGVHCFVEKPIATTTDEAAALVDLAARRKLVLQVGHIQRVLFAALDARTLVERPRFAEAVRAAPYKARATDVGVVLDLMIHDIDLALALFGEPVSAVAASGGRVVSATEDWCNARLTFASGAVASLTASRVSDALARSMRIFGPAGSATIDLQARRAVAIRRTADGTLAREERSAPGGDDLTAELAGFVASIRDGAPPLASGADGLAALDVATRIIAQLGN
jgi:predicted dehydrogenase